MSIDKTANIEVDLLIPDQAQGDVTNTQQMYVLDTLVQGLIKDVDLTAPPGGEADGDRYIVATGGTGAWLGLDGKIVTNRDATGQWQVDELKEGYVFWIEDDHQLKVWDGAAWHVLESGSSINGLQIYYTGKHGSDSNNGRSDAQAFLTFGKAVIDATAASPTANNRFVIFCHDAGIYTEDFTLPQYVSLYAPNATTVGTITLGDDCFINIGRPTKATTGSIIDYNHAGRCTVMFKQMVATGLCMGVRARGGGVVEVIGHRLEVENNIGLYAQSGIIDPKINDIVLTGSVGPIGVQIDGPGNMYGTIGQIDERGSNGTAIITAAGGGSGTLTVNKIFAATAYNIGVGSTLNIFVGSVTGTKTVNGTLNETIAGEPKFASWNFIAPTGRVGVNSPYARAACTNIFDVNASGKIPPDFRSLIKASIRFIVQTGSLINTVLATLHYGNLNERQNNHIGIGLPGYSVAATGRIGEVDVTSLILGNLAAGDSIGCEVLANGVATQLDMLTFDIEYK